MSQGAPRGVLMTVFAIPPEASGTGVVVRRLLQNFSAEEIVLMGRNPHRRSVPAAQRLHVPIVRVRWLPLGLRGERFSRILGVAPAVLQGAWTIRTRNLTAILAMFPDECSLLSGYLLHRITGLPLLAYFCDLYMEDRCGSGWEARVARWLQPRVLTAATRVIAVSQGMVDFYRERYGIEALHLPTCINQALPAFEPLPPPGRPFRIAYSGNINATRIDCLRALVRAIGEDPSYTLHYFTPQTPQYLRSVGVWSPNSSAEFVPDEAILVRRLMDCDVLYLPLTFEIKDHSREQMATCFATKSYEYLLARRPVLVHCPGDYFLARFFRHWACGLVVDDPSPSALVEGLRMLRESVDLRADLVRHGLEAARQFEGPHIAAVLREEIAKIRAGTGAVAA